MNYTLSTHRHGGPSKDFLERKPMYGEAIPLSFKVKWMAVGAVLTLVAVLLAGCEQPKAEPLPWYKLPEDPQVYAFVVKQCLDSAKGPASTRYNDWDEAIKACGSIASNAARYCPKGARCAPDSSSRQDVRAVLPEKPQ
jgi:hypothetical protein